LSGQALLLRYSLQLPTTRLWVIMSKRSTLAAPWGLGLMQRQRRETNLRATRRTCSLCAAMSSSRPLQLSAIAALLCTALHHYAPPCSLSTAEHCSALLCTPLHCFAPLCEGTCSISIAWPSLLPPEYSRCGQRDELIRLPTQESLCVVLTIECLSTHIQAH
jgi:hypothetical protein